MTSWTLVTRSIRFYWRTHLAVVLGVAVSTAVLVGALVVGDSVRHTLRILALSRLGKVHLALASQSRYFRAALADDLGAALNTETALVLQLRGIASNSDGTARANRVQVLGVDERFWMLGGQARGADLTGDEVVVNKRLAAQIGVEEGDDVLLRVEKISLLPRDAPMAIGEDFSVALRMTVKAIASDSSFGRFSLQASQIAPFNAFVSIARLQKRLGLSDRANVLLIGGSDVTDANAALRKHWKIADAGLELRELPDQGLLELRTDRVFLDPAVVSAAERAIPGAVGVLTYFVNEIRLRDRTTPYSIVAAIGGTEGLGDKETRRQGDKGKTGERKDGSHVFIIPPDMADDEILINTWLAEDLQAKAGDILELTYLVFGPMRKLEEQRSSFRVRAVLPMQGAAADPELMPVFPGLSEVENCRDWEPGIPINLSKIRKKDEEYWNLYRGTPKAFVTLKAGQHIWSNRFGSLTALRYPMHGTPAFKPRIETAIKNELDPASIGLLFRPVREQALAASAQAMDFGQLFLGLSFFLVVAALLLTGLLFVFGIEQRTEEAGTLLAVGFRPHRVRRLLLFEGSILVLIGAFLGTAGGVLYTKAVLYALSTVWSGAVRTADFHYHARPLTLMAGISAGVAAALLAIWATSRRQAKHPARELLAGELEPRISMTRRVSSRKSESQKTREPVSRLSGFLAFRYVAAVSGIAALAILGIVGAGRDIRAAGAFFGAGALLLVCCLGLSHAVLTGSASRAMHRGLTGMGIRNGARRWGRSLAIIGLLACGGFLVIAVGANRHDPMRDAGKRSSGTGGFALYGESTLPVLHDLNTEEGRKVYGLDTDAMEDFEFVPFRVHDGDDASCLNLNRPQNPRLLGVRPEALQERGAFTFAKAMDDPLNSKPWLLLKGNDQENVINAIGDQNTVSWSVGKSVGDKLMYTDERGQTFHIKIAGTIANSILQGGFIISEDEFIRRFPSESGYRMFLVDAPPEKSPQPPLQGGEAIDDPMNVSEVSSALTRALQDVGLELTPAAERLSDFNTLQNTYLSIFQSLGGLAMLLGSLGLGIVVLRNVMERRSELALLRAVGFANRSLRWLILSEHWLLLLMGLASGVVSGLVAVLPALRSPGADIPYASLTLTLSAILLNGAFWTWLAARLALRGPLLAALRNE